MFDRLTLLFLRFRLAAEQARFDDAKRNRAPTLADIRRLSNASHDLRVWRNHMRQKGWQYV